MNVFEALLLARERAARKEPMWRDDNWNDLTTADRKIISRLDRGMRTAPQLLDLVAHIDAMIYRYQQEQL